MVMRSDLRLRHWDVDQIQGELKSWFPRHEVDVVNKCYNFVYGDNDLDWHFGEYPQLTQSVIDNPDNQEFQTIVHECRSRCALLWAGGQACIRVVCICDLGTRTRPSIVVACTLQAVFQQAGYNSIGPVELFCV